MPMTTGSLLCAAGVVVLISSVSNSISGFVEVGMLEGAGDTIPGIVYLGEFAGVVKIFGCIPLILAGLQFEIEGALKRNLLTASVLLWLSEFMSAIESWTVIDEQGAGILSLGGGVLFITIMLMFMGYRFLGWAGMAADKPLIFARRLMTAGMLLLVMNALALVFEGIALGTSAGAASTPGLPAVAIDIWALADEVMAVAGYGLLVAAASSATKTAAGQQQVGAELRPSAVLIGQQP